MAATGATLGEGASAQGRVVGVTTDSRGDVRGKLFVALRGERFDGHTHVAQALQQGAAAVLVEAEIAGVPNSAILRVPATLDALGSIARLHRRRWGGRVVAIGGSAGKTTTRSATSLLLERLLPGTVHSSVGNLNNRIGVPMVLLGLSAQHQVAVVEVGTNQQGEVAQLEAITEPDIGLITLIALEHTEGLGTLDDIEAEEGALLRNANTVIVNGDDDRALRQASLAKAQRKLSYGRSPHCDYRVVERHLISPQQTRVSFVRPGQSSPHSFETRLLGMPGAYAALAAISVADVVLDGPVPEAQLQAFFNEVRVGETGRLRALELADGSLLLDDTYNANPASVRASIEVGSELARLRQTRLILVLGEMRELGAVSASEHAGLARAVLDSGATALLAVAGDAQNLALAAKSSSISSEFVSNTEEAMQRCARLAKPGDVILCKGSRGVGLDRLVTDLINKRGLAS
ncbi:MAG TPA: UDP-N-acetylmuramoyl-tripeptide--D-alanyl-D-alanine ligase [Polyangiaceae bacterium]|nr:UDP-N-acetylmuramoyl-tripeptide--D-alanyl-D-alanine ligase [Polyangiaceae bacterium]